MNRQHPLLKESYLEDYRLYAGELLAVNAVGRQLRDLINSRLARLWLTV